MCISEKQAEKGEHHMSQNYSEDTILEAQVRNNILVITPTISEITYKNSRDFLSAVKDEIDREGRDIILNMENVDLIDSVSLGTLVAIKKYAKTHKREVYIANLSALIMELFQLLNFPLVFEIYDTVEAALAGK